jgi:phosphinothricin acetyltransferase
MSAADWPAVSDIYREGIESGTATFETAVPTWEVWDGGHFPAPRLVAADREDLLGWAALSPVSKRAAYAGVAEVSIYVAARARRRGIGLLLLGSLVDSSEERGFWTVQANIMAANEASIALHERCGFRIVGTRERLSSVRGVWRDVVLMERRRRR